MAEPAPAGTPVKLPILDISNPEDPTVGKAMLDAATDGFMLRAKGPTSPLRMCGKHLRGCSKSFCASPIDEKESCRIQSNNRGWSGCTLRLWTLNTSGLVLGRITPKVKYRTYARAFSFGEFTTEGKAQQPLPPALVRHEAEVGNFASLCTKTCNRILSLLSLGLKSTATMSPHSSQPATTPRRAQQVAYCATYIIHPSQRPQTADYDHAVDVRAGAHSDYGNITLLLQRLGQPGLKILTPEGTWAPVAVDRKA
ncbi:hypothetical protein BDV10DRAFT_181850 [Aspergillus recurvatus]